LLSSYGPLIIWPSGHNQRERAALFPFFKKVNVAAYCGSVRLKSKENNACALLIKLFSSIMFTCEFQAAISHVSFSLIYRENSM
jgi:hypothetical protein